jgi:hypothetical protein
MHFRTFEIEFSFYRTELKLQVQFVMHPEVPTLGFDKLVKLYNILVFYFRIRNLHI